MRIDSKVIQQSLLVCLLVAAVVSVLLNLLWIRVLFVTVLDNLPSLTDSVATEAFLEFDNLFLKDSQLFFVLTQLLDDILL